MGHEHLNLENLFEIIATSELGDNDIAEIFKKCEFCSECLERLKFFIDEQIKNDCTPVENLYSKMKKYIDLNKEIFDMLSRSNLVNNTGCNCRNGPDLKSILIKSTIYSACSTTIVFIIIFFLLKNFFWDKLNIQDINSNLKVKYGASLIVDQPRKSHDGIWNSKLTLKELENKYGQLAKIKMKNGKEFIGAFYTQKKDLVIITTKGKIVVPSLSVKMIEPHVINK